MGAREQGADVARWSVIPRTLSFLTNGGDVLLLKRSLHTRIFPGRYNGLGGHLERNEDPLIGARREIVEESGLMAHQIERLRLRGVCHVDPGGAVGIMVFVFTAEAATRQVRDTQEGQLHWVALNDTASLPLVEDVPLLLVRLFGPAASDALFFAHVSYDATDKMIMTFA